MVFERSLRSSPESEPTWDALVGLSDSSQRPSEESFGILKLLRVLERSIWEGSRLLPFYLAMLRCQVPLGPFQWVGNALLRDERGKSSDANRDNLMDSEERYMGIGIFFLVRRKNGEIFYRQGTGLS